ncbi:HAD-IA family hydrolase [Micromonospora echinofusca]|uniref:HAD-IA family hydrolase n=2 Tax=Actinomycetes TaxID=1760 RepID=UPI0033F0B194
MHRASGRLADAVIFDWSGTLVDEIDATAAAHVSAIALLGGAPLTEHEWKQRVGVRWIDLYVEQGVSRRRMRRAAQTFEREYKKRIGRVHPIPGAAEVLAELHSAGVRMAVLSNQLRSCVMSAAERYDWAKYFQVIVAASGTSAPKADPAALWGILRDLEAEPSRTVMVDDMTEGIALGRTAGLVTVGIKSNLKHNLEDADYRISYLSELTSLAPLVAYGEGAQRSLGHATKEYRDLYEKREAQKNEGVIRRIPGWYHAENRAFVRWLLTRTGSPGGRTMVDVGSGASNHADEMLNRGFGRAVRIDLSANALLRSKRLIDRSPSVIDVQGDAARLPIRADVSDLTLCTEVLEHVISPAAVLQELGRVTRSGGWLVIAVPNSGRRTHPLLRRLQRKSYHAGHVREYTRQTIVPPIEAAGFDVQAIFSRWLFAYWLFFSIERGTRALPAIRALTRYRKADLSSRRVVYFAMLAENFLAGRWAKRGLGIVVIARKKVADKGSTG